MKASLFSEKLIPYFRRWEKFILGAIDILAITLAFQCSYYLNYLDFGGFFFYHTRLLKLSSLSPLSGL